VARIGAALASASRRATASVGAEKSATQADMPLAASDAGATSPVHVVARQTWLQPVSPAFSPDLNRQAAADRAALDAPRAAHASAAEPGVPEAPAAVADAAPTAGAKTEPEASAGFAFSGGPAVLAHDDSDSAPPSTRKLAAAPAAPSAASLAAAPRRDLEITLAPKDLGGLAVRMKSAGDRLEIAFVAEKGETARMISDNSATLASQLHGAGLGLGGIDINAASRMEAGAAATPPASAGASVPGGSADSRENAQNAPHRQDSSGRGRQDQSHETSEKTSEPRASNGDRGLYL
jgi:flagellar hook-length control protein FliK